MAASSDAEIFEEAARALQGFINDDIDDPDQDSPLDDYLANVATVKETKQRYMDEIERLREEVASLEEQVEDEEQKLLQVKMTSLERIESALPKKSKDFTSNGIDKATQDHLKLQSTFTGIHFTDATVKVLNQDAEQTTRQHYLQGHCSGLEFQVEFKVVEKRVIHVDSEETQSSSSTDQETKSHITLLTILIDERASCELDGFTQHTKKHCALQPFLKGYGQYAQRFDGRHKAFEHFKKQYPDVVTLPQGSYGSTMKFGRQPNDSVMYTITWAIGISPKGQVDEDITLQVMSSKEAHQLDEQNVLKSAPERFQQMLQRLGIERAIGSLIHTVTS